VSYPFRTDAEWQASERRTAQKLATRRLELRRKGLPYDLNDKLVLGLLPVDLSDGARPLNQKAREADRKRQQGER
jgi:hypothetical protein